MQWHKTVYIHIYLILPSIYFFILFNITFPNLPLLYLVLNIAKTYYLNTQNQAKDESDNPWNEVNSFKHVKTNQYFNTQYAYQKLEHINITIMWNETQHTEIWND